MQSVVSRYWSLLIALMILGLSLALPLSESLSANDGHLIYTLDDAYIHMATAKNFALHGVWGVTPYQYSSAVSSILWPLLLSVIYWFTGPSEITPFLLNVLLAAGVLFSLHYLLTRQRLHQWAILLALLAAIFWIPLPAMVFMGMEHTLHILIMIVWLYLVGRAISDREVSRTLRVVLLVCTVLLAMSRYEAMAAIVAAGLLFVLRWRWRDVLLLVVCGAAPLIIYGLISVANGSMFLPNSVYIKAGLASYTRAVSFLQPLHPYQLFLSLTDSYVVLSELFVLVVVFFVRRQEDIKEGRGDVWSLYITMILIWTGTAVLQMQYLNEDGWIFRRYDAYLIGAFILTVFTSLHPFLSPESAPVFSQIRFTGSGIFTAVIAFIGLTLLAYASVAHNATTMLTLLVPSTEDVYRQQYQMGQFLNEYYPDAVVAAHDIGAINYLSDINTVDLFGLGTVEVARAKRDGIYERTFINTLATARGVEIAVIYDPGFTDMVPYTWQRIASWSLPTTTSIGYHTVTFYAVAKGEAESLKEKLELFAPRLPEIVIQRFYKTEGASDD